MDKYNTTAHDGKVQRKDIEKNLRCGQSIEFEIGQPTKKLRFLFWSKQTAILSPLLSGSMTEFSFQQRGL